MSRKQFISAEEHLAKFGLTVQDANEFISSNLNQPESIFYAAFDYGVTKNMLSEITSASLEVICQYFEAAGFNCNELDSTSILVNSDLGILEKLINFNDGSGVLSTEALRISVEPLLTGESPLNGPFFGPIFKFQQNDGIYDADELGVGHLNSVPAIDESIESLFYGSLINFFSELDSTELEKINFFDGTQNEYQVFLLNVLDENSPSGAWSNDELADFVINKAAQIINEHPPIDLDINWIGILDSVFTYH